MTNGKLISWSHQRL